MNETIIAGADIGGSHITVALIDINAGKVLDKTRRRKQIDTNTNAEEIFDSWSVLIKESFNAGKIKPSRIGIAMPGPFDYINGISYIKDQNKYDSLYGLNVKERLAEKLNISVEDISILNDAACFLQGELFSGAAKGCNRVIGLTLGTGLGSAIYVGGETEDANFWCSEFKDGIAEDYLSTRWFVSRYKELSGEVVKDVKDLVGRLPGNLLVQQVFDEFGSNLANFLIRYIKKEQLQLVILGGNVSLAFSFFATALKDIFQREEIKVGIRAAELGESAALLGAASGHNLAVNAFNQNPRY